MSSSEEEDQIPSIELHIEALESVIVETVKRHHVKQAEFQSLGHGSRCL
jgi:hypothetical protein